MGAHVWWPWFLEHNWFPKGRLSGWSPDWYAGFPVGQYYFPLPGACWSRSSTHPVRAVQRRVQARHGLRPAAAAGRARTTSHAACGHRGRRRPRSRSRRPGMLVQTRNDWQIYGGNIASTLAGEFSFTIALALGLFALGALGKHARHREAAVAARGADRGVARCRTSSSRSSSRCSRCCCGSRAGRVARGRSRSPVGAVAVALTAVWSLPLIARHAMTQSMRYEKVVPAGNWKLLGLRRGGPARPVEHTIEGVVRGRRHRRPDAARRSDQAAAVAAVVDLAARGRRDRRGRLVPAPLDARAARRRARARGAVRPVARARGVEHAVPAVLAADVGLPRRDGRDRDPAAGGGRSSRWPCRWIREGDLARRARPGVDRRAPADDPTVDRRRSERSASPRRLARATPPGWEPPAALRPERVERRARRVSAIALAVLVGVIGVVVGEPGVGARATTTRTSRSQAWARVELLGLRAEARVARVPEHHADDGHAAARAARCGSRRRSAARTRSTTTARRSRSSCCRTSPTAASARWKASTSSRRRRPRSTSSP